MKSVGSQGLGVRVDRRAIAYFVHDLNDAAVARRAAMLVAAGLRVEIAGFHRGDAPRTVAGLAATPLGRTRDAKLVRRAAVVARSLLWRRGAARVAAGKGVVIARTLEMLAMAATLAGPGQRLVYECLDIHRLMLGSGAIGRMLRALERRLLARVALVIVSSPRFRDDYFRDRQRFAGAVLVIENKVPADRVVSPIAPPAGPPWRIGWFGMLRCRRSLDMLGRLVAASEGTIEVLVAGKPSDAELPHLAATVSSSPGMTFVGPYTPDQLAALYGQVHFAWTIDFFEEGLNSAWLLPNRLYEGLANGAVPVALGQVETGAWLVRNHVGCVFDAGDEIGPFLAALTPAGYAALREAVRALPAGRLVQRPDERDAIVAALTARG